MFHHLSIVVSDFVRSAALYDACLAPLGIRRTETDLDWAIYATDAGHPFLWLGSEIPTYWGSGTQAGSAPIHLAFCAPSREAVDAFYRAAMECEAEDHGPPGIRVSYANFYSAYILDYDGNNIEATLRED